MLLGLVGKPSCGKSTFFKAATLAEVDIASYAFTTIKPNHGIGYVKIDCIDTEFGVQCMPKHGFCLQHKRFVPVELMDVAGLVPGASEGKGLGNQFLDDLRKADVFMHIVDASGKSDNEGKPLPEGEKHDPVLDINFLEEELNKWFYNILMKVWRSFARKTEMEGQNFAQAITTQFSGLKVSEDQVKEVLLDLGLPEKQTSWTDEQVMEFATALRKKSKPMIVAANKIDLPGAYENYKNIKEQFPDLMVVPCSADAELALREASKHELIDYIPGEKDFTIKDSEKLNENQKKALEKIKTNVLQKFEFGTGVQQVLNKAVFDFLKYIAVFPASANKLQDSDGNILPDCFLMPPESTALDFAYYLHTDFGKNFVRAIDARTNRALGKDYKLKQGDAMEIISA